MALTDLLSALELEAAEELEEAERAARQEGALLREAGRAEAERLLAEALRSADVEGGQASARLLAEASGQAAAQLREAREQALAEVRRAAEERLSRLREDPGYQQVLTALFGSALAAVPDAVQVHVDLRDVEAVHRLATDRGLGVVADRQTWGGVVVTGRGRFADNTLESRLAASWPQMRARLADRWEGEPR